MDQIKSVKLRWSTAADKKFRSAYSGESERNKRRKKANNLSLFESARGTPSITSFLNRPPLAQNRDYDDPQDSPLLMQVSDCLKKLEEDNVANISSNKKFEKSSNYDHLRYLSIKRYFLLGKGKMAASAEACLIFSRFPQEPDRNAF